METNNTKTQFLGMAIFSFFFVIMALLILLIYNIALEDNSYSFDKGTNYSVENSLYVMDE